MLWKCQTIMGMHPLAIAYARAGKLLHKSELEDRLWAFVRPLLFVPQTRSTFQQSFFDFHYLSIGRCSLPPSPFTSGTQCHESCSLWPAPAFYVIAAFVLAEFAVHIPTSEWSHGAHTKNHGRRNVNTNRQRAAVCRICHFVSDLYKSIYYASTIYISVTSLRQKQRWHDSVYWTNALSGFFRPFFFRNCRTAYKK